MPLYLFVHVQYSSCLAAIEVSLWQRTRHTDELDKHRRRTGPPNHHSTKFTSTALNLVVRLRICNASHNYH